MERIGRKVIIGTSFTFGAMACIACGVLFFYGEDESDDYVLNQAGRYLSFFGKFCISAVHGLVYVYVAEVFPTSVRSIGTAISLLGDETWGLIWASFKFNWLSQSQSKIGAILAPYIIAIKLIWIPFMIFGGCSFLAAILTGTTLIETRNKHMPNTLSEMKERGSKKHKSEIDDEDL